MQCLAWDYVPWAKVDFRVTQGRKVHELREFFFLPLTTYQIRSRSFCVPTDMIFPRLPVSVCPCFTCGGEQDMYPT